MAESCTKKFQLGSASTMRKREGSGEVGLRNLHVRLRSGITQVATQAVLFAWFSVCVGFIYVGIPALEHDVLLRLAGRPASLLLRVALDGSTAVAGVLCLAHISAVVLLFRLRTDPCSVAVGALMYFIVTVLIMTLVGIALLSPSFDFSGI
jgi:hypothetical protein